jgi:Domain of unknown function (DUF5615)
MLKLATDENFNNDILRALLRRISSVDIVRVQDAGLGGADDETVLAWAAAEGRILLTHDVTTVTKSHSNGPHAAKPCRASSRCRPRVRFGKQSMTSYSSCNAATHTSGIIRCAIFHCAERVSPDEATRRTGLAG